MCSPAPWSERGNSQGFSITCLGMSVSWGTRDIPKVHVSTAFAALAAVVAAVAKGPHRDPILGKHLQNSGCLEIGHGKVQEKPRLLKTIPKPHWNALPEYTGPKRSRGLSYFIHSRFLAGLFCWKLRTLKLAQSTGSKHATWLPCGCSLEDMSSGPSAQPCKYA